VAERAGVAISTVSRVLNGGSVSTRMREQVERAIEELGYSPSVAARSLVSRRTGCIGLAVNSTQGPWFSQVLQGVEEATAPANVSLLLGSMKLHGRYNTNAVSAWIHHRRIDGLIFVRYSRREKALFTEACRAGLPVVLVAPDEIISADFTALCDNVEAGFLIAAHLAKLGHREVAFAGGPEESHDTQNRLRGLVDGLRAHGVEEDLTDLWFGSTYYAASGVEYSERLLAMPARERPTAVVLASDAMALGFIGAMQRHGVPVPQAISVAGFDGIPEAELVWPRLTTVVQPTRVMALSACRALLERIENPEQDKVSSAEYGATLMVRESTGPVSAK
jgi:DNA-binding LacI/PurR family transcriptional regulator